MSFWIKQTGGSTTEFDYNNFNVDVLIDGSSVSPSQYYKSTVIEGWQQVVYTFSIASGTNNKFELSIVPDETYGLYLDDLRIHPNKASFKSYVYHPIDLKLMAELDENNYATFYEYDNEGRLVRVKKETKEGIKTLQETRTHLSQKAL